jgi:hypothetical protein
MSERIQRRERNGKIWTIARVSREDADERDLAFWLEELTPEERVEAVEAALETCLKAKGTDGVPRPRRVHRRVERREREVPDRRGARGSTLEGAIDRQRVPRRRAKRIADNR